MKKEGEIKTIISSTNLKGDEKQSSSNNEHIANNNVETKEAKKVNLKKAVVAGTGVAAASLGAGVVIGANNPEEVNQFIDGTFDKVNETVSSIHDSITNEEIFANETINVEEGLNIDSLDQVESNIPIFEAVIDDNSIDSLENLLELNESDFDSDVLNISSEQNESYDYIIQSGDTLSEIAADNNTSIEHLMELNPDISDPNMIFTGDNISIPTGDEESNPYASWDGDNIEIVPENEININEENNGFAAVDWASFEDEPISEIAIDGNTENSSEFGLTEDYTTENNYTTDNNLAFQDSGNEFILEDDNFYDGNLTDNSFTFDENNNENYNNEIESTDFESGDYSDENSFDDDMDWSC
jgi:LysM repeat protein